MSGRRPVSRTQGDAARPPVPRRERKAATLAVLVTTVAVVAWFAGGALIQRAHATRLPAPPDVAAMPAPVQADIAAADAAARAQPTSGAAVGELGMVYHASLLPVLAHQAYAIAGELAPDAARWPYYQGLLHEERGEQDAALEAFTRVTTREPRNGLAWWHIAEIAFKHVRPDVAQDAYERARDAPPPPAFLIAGRVPRQAMPLTAYAEFGLARVSIERGDLAAAAARLDSLVRGQPRFGAARTLLLQLRQRPQAAESADLSSARARAYVPPADPLLDAIVARSQHPDLLLKHVALAARGGDQAWREFLVRRALDANPRGLDVLLEMASTLQALGRHTEALEYLRQGEQVAPGDHHTLVQQGKSLSELDRLEEAEQVLRRAARVRDAAAEYNLGTVLDRQDRWDEARSHYEQALAIDPFHARALNNLAVGLDRRGQTVTAMALYARALKAAPDHAETHSNLGSALIQQGQYAEATRALETAIALDPNAPDAHNNLGIALARSGRLADARAEFEAALQIAPRHPDARRNLDALMSQRP